MKEHLDKGWHSNYWEKMTAKLVWTRSSARKRCLPQGEIPVGSRALDLLETSR